MKTTLELPDDLFRLAKATAALHGTSLKALVTDALRGYLERQELPQTQGWRSVFGLARPEEVAEIDEVLSEELGRVDPDEWR